MLWTEKRTDPDNAMDRKADGEKAEKGRMPEKHAGLRLHPEADSGERGNRK